MMQNPIYATIYLLLPLFLLAGCDSSLPQPTRDTTHQDTENPPSGDQATPQAAEKPNLRGEIVFTIENKPPGSPAAAPTQALPIPIIQVTLGQMEDFAKLHGASLLSDPKTRARPPTPAAFKQSVLHRMAELEIIRAEAKARELTPPPEEISRAGKMIQHLGEKSQEYGLGAVSPEGINEFASMQAHRRLLTGHLAESLTTEQRWSWYAHHHTRMGVTVALVFNGATSREIDEFALRHGAQIREYHRENRHKYRMPPMKRVVLVGSPEPQCLQALNEGATPSGSPLPTQARLDQAIEDWLRDHLASQDKGDHGHEVSTKPAATTVTILGTPLTMHTMTVTRNMLPLAWDPAGKQGPVRLSRAQARLLPLGEDPCPPQDFFMGVQASIPGKDRELDASLEREIGAQLCVAQEKNFSARSKLKKAREVLESRGDPELIKQMGLQLKSIDPFVNQEVIPQMGYAPHVTEALFTQATQGKEGMVIGPFRVDQHLAVFRIDTIQTPNKEIFTAITDDLPSMILSRDGHHLLSNWLEGVYPGKHITVEDQIIDESGIIQLLQEQMIKGKAEAEQTDHDQ